MRRGAIARRGAGELLFSVIYESKTPILTFALFFFIAYAGTLRGSRTVTYTVLGSTAAFAVFTMLQTLKTPRRAPRSRRGLTAAYPLATRPLLPVLRRFDLYGAVTDASFVPDGRWLSPAAFVRRVVSGFVPCGPSGDPFVSSGVRWAREVRAYTIPLNGSTVSLADGVVAEGFAVAGWIGVAAEAVVLAVATALVARALLSPRPVRPGARARRADPARAVRTGRAGPGRDPRRGGADLRGDRSGLAGPLWDHAARARWRHQPPRSPGMWMSTRIHVGTRNRSADRVACTITSVAGGWSAPSRPRCRRARPGDGKGRFDVADGRRELLDTAGQHGSDAHWHFAQTALPLLRRNACVSSADIRVLHFHGPWFAEGRVQGNSIPRVTGKWLTELIGPDRRPNLRSHRGVGGVPRHPAPVFRGQEIPRPGGAPRCGRASVPRGRQECGAAALGLPQDVPLFVTVRRLEPRMGIDVALEALRRVPDAHLAVCGTGSLSEQLRADAAELGVARRATFLGRVPDVDLPAVTRRRTSPGRPRGASRASASWSSNRSRAALPRSPRTPGSGRGAGPVRRGVDRGRRARSRRWPGGWSRR